MILIFCFVDLSYCDEFVLQADGLSPTICACVCSLKETPNRPISNDITILKKGVFEVDESKTLVIRYVDVSSITKPCFMVPNISRINDDHNNHVDWIFVESKKNGQNYFSYCVVN